MTEQGDIPSGMPESGKRSQLAIIAALASIFLLPFILNANNFFSSDQSLVAAKTSTKNAQTVRLFKPLSFDNEAALGGAIVATIDNALVGTQSVLDDQSEIFLEQTGHENQIYIVRQGDTLSQIAESFGVSQNTILWANKLSSKKNLKVGQKLVILPISGVLHTVAKGDTLAKIAKNLEGDVDEIISFNKLDRDAKLVVGTELTVPGGSIKKSVAVSRTVTKKAGSSSFSTVRSPSGLLEVPAQITYTWKNGVRTSRLRGTGGPTYTGYYIRPINGYRKSRGLHGYNSVDFAAPQGTPVLASASGKVVIAKHGGWNGGYGKYVAIEHGNGTQTLYAHQSGVIVNKGQYVVQGQVIGYVGTTGNSSGNHLHFEVRGAKNPF